MFAEVRDVTAKQFIEMGLAYAGMSQRQLADNLGWTPQQLSNRMTTGKFTLDEWESIGKAMGAELAISWRFGDRTVQA